MSYNDSTIESLKFIKKKSEKSNYFKNYNGLYCC